MVGGESSSESGLGRAYWRQIARIWWNHDLLDGFSQTRAVLATELMIDPGSLEIMPNNDNWRRWRRAVPGRDPARKNTTGCWVFEMSFCIPSIDASTVFSRIFVSGLLKTSVATPEVRTGNTRTCKTLNDAAGFPRWLRARPT